jgi:hypothetical protein
MKPLRPLLRIAALLCVVNQVRAGLADPPPFVRGVVSVTEVSGNTTYLATESFDYLLHSDGGLVTLDLRKEGISRIVRSIASGFALISVRGRNEVTIRRFDREGRWLDELPIVIDTPGWSELLSADVEVFDDGGLLAAWSDGATVRGFRSVRQAIGSPSR